MRIDTDVASIMEEYRKCTNYNVLQDYYNKTAMHENFYIGKQWQGVYAPDLDKPVLNFIRRVCSFLTAMVASSDVNVYASPYIHSPENVALADLVNIRLQQAVENSQLKKHSYTAVLDGAVTGDGFLYWYYDGKNVNCQPLKGTNVLFANPHSNDLQAQPFILVERREYLERVQQMAGENGQQADKIKADENYMVSVESIPMVTVITKLYKQNGKVWYTQVTKDGVVTPPESLGYSIYPVTRFSWDVDKNSYHGVGVVENLIPNQIAVNKLWAMALLHQKTMAFPKVFFDKTKLDKWTNKVGAAIGVIGNPHDAVATSFKANDMSEQLMDLVEKTIAYTKEFMGANDTSLGNVNPENTSAILAVQRSATIPLENQKQAYVEFLNDSVSVILDIMREKYGTRYMETAGGDGVYITKEFNFSEMNPSEFSYVISTEDSSPWSEGIRMQTLENLYTKQILTDAYDYVQAIPSTQLKNKQQILKKLEQAR
ncbi:MAG: hypothetical protein IKU54_03880 [Oscillospiraceae bacterium]|nr:hypothetical protein [Oscillospiraceae bacterium]